MFSHRVRSRLKSAYKVKFSRWAAICYRCLGEADRLPIDVAVLSRQLTGGARFQRCKSYRISALRAAGFYVLVAKHHGGLLVLDIQKDERSARPQRKSA